jgi:transposase-like protein
VWCTSNANARNHFSKLDNAEFQQRWRVIKSCWSPEVGNQQFDQLCDRFFDSYPSFIAELRKKRQHYLAFLAYPEAIRRSLSTTNVVEAINGQLEITRRNSGGYFHSEGTLKLKLGLALTSLEIRLETPGMQHLLYFAPVQCHLSASLRERRMTLPNTTFLTSAAGPALPQV